MAKRLQLRKGNTADHSTFTGALAELSVNTQTGSLLLHDGVTVGGHAVAMAAAVDSALANKQNTSEKGQANGYASLGSDGLVPLAQLPAAATGGVDSVAVNAPLVNNGTPADVAISIPAASAIVDGYMSSANWSKLDGIQAGANNYVLPVAGISLGGVKSGTDITVDINGNVSVNDDSHNHIIGNIDGLQSALDGKVDDGQVLTNVPAGAVFTDTTYTDAEIKTKYEANANTNAFTDAEKTKVGHISVTQAVNLDVMEARINELDASVVLKGEWDASIGDFPDSLNTTPALGVAIKSGMSWIVSVGGTVGGIEFKANDRVVALIDNASNTVYTGNWHKADYTDAVLSVAGKTGAVTLVEADITDLGNYETAFSKNTAFNKNFGTGVGTVAEGNDTRILAGLTAYGWGDHGIAGYLLASAYTANDVLTKIKTVDGAGSGLDADLLDGNQASAFATASHGHAGTEVTLSTTNFDNNLSAADNTVQKAFDTLDALIAGGGGSAQPFDDTPLEVTTTSTLLSTNSRNIFVKGDGGIDLTLFNVSGLDEDVSMLSISNLSLSTITVKLPSGAFFHNIEPNETYIYYVYDNTNSNGIATKFKFNKTPDEAFYSNNEFVTSGVGTSLSGTSERFFKLSTYRYVYNYYYNDGSNSYGRMYVVEDNQDGSFTLGAVYQTSGIYILQGIASADLTGGTKFVAGMYGPSTYNYAWLFTVAANLTLTRNATYTLDSTYDQYAADMTTCHRISDTLGLITYETSTNVVYYRLFQINDTTLTLGNAVNLSTYWHPKEIVMLSSTQLVALSQGHVASLTYSGTTLTNIGSYAITGTPSMDYADDEVNCFMLSTTSAVVLHSGGVSKFTVNTAGVTLIGSTLSISDGMYMFKKSSTRFVVIGSKNIYEIDTTTTSPTIVQQYSIHNPINADLTKIVKYNGILGKPLLEVYVSVSWKLYKLTIYTYGITW